MIMIIAINYIFYLMWCLINSWKYFQKIFRPYLKKSTTPFLLTPQPKNCKRKSPLFANIETFSVHPCSSRSRKVGGHNE